jgi:hypothetical protein
MMVQSPSQMVYVCGGMRQSRAATTQQMAAQKCQTYYPMYILPITATAVVELLILGKPSWTSICRPCQQLYCLTSCCTIVCRVALRRTCSLRAAPSSSPAAARQQQQPAAPGRSTAASGQHCWPAAAQHSRMPQPQQQQQQPQQPALAVLALGRSRGLGVLACCCHRIWRGCCLTHSWKRA